MTCSGKLQGIWLRVLTSNGNDKESRYYIIVLIHFVTASANNKDSYYLYCPLMAMLGT